MSRQRTQPQANSGATDNDVISRVVTSVAERKGLDPSALEPRLFDVIDPDALTTLVECAGADTPVSMEFAYAGYRVTVDAAEQVDVTVRGTAS